jgi:protein XagA
LGGRLAAAMAALAILCHAEPALAWAWPMDDGKTQAIFKYESETADEAFDPNGVVVPVAVQDSESLSLFVEHGLTSRITLQGKLGWTRGTGQFAEFEGRGPIDLGARYAFLKGPKTAISVYAGVTFPGDGRNAAYYSEPGAGEKDVEVRFLAGRSGTWLKRHAFAELQLARIGREGLPDETRVETTIGWHPRKHWLLMAQTYAGRAEAEPIAPLWLKSEVSVVRDLKDWRLQAGWRSSSLGVESPVSRGPVIAIWKTF